jgi:hypothetical protein
MEATHVQFDIDTIEPCPALVHRVAGAFGKASPWPAVGLVTLGALVGGVFTVWTLVMPIAALVLIVLFARGALRAPSVAVKPAAS